MPATSLTPLRARRALRSTSRLTRSSRSIAFLLPLSLRLLQRTPDLPQLVIERCDLPPQVCDVRARGQVRRVPQPPCLALELVPHAGARARRQAQCLREPLRARDVPEGRAERALDP